MTAFPVKSNKENSALSPLFGKAKYFAFYDGKSLEVLKNDAGDGIDVIKWFVQKGVKNIIIKEMGSNPFKEIQKHDINIFYSGDDRITIDEVIKKIDENTLEPLSGEKLENIVKKHESRHKHDDHHHHHHDTKRVIFPTNEDMGYLSKIGAHFGKAKFYTIITTNHHGISNVEVVENPGHSSGGCGDAISNIMSLKPDVMVVSGIGTSPAKGFANAGLEVYFDKISATVQDSLKLLNEEKLQKVGSSGTCSTN